MTCLTLLSVHTVHWSRMALRMSGIGRQFTVGIANHHDFGSATYGDMPRGGSGTAVS